MVASFPLTPEQALQKRDELVNDGFTVVPNVLPEALLTEFREFTSQLFETIKVDASLKYQGSSQFVYSLRSRKPGSPIDFTTHHKVVDKLNDDPTWRRVAELLGLEALRPRSRRAWDDINVIVLSKPPNGPPLYWHQDFRDWNSPVAATPWPHQIFLSYYLTDTTRENGCLRVIPGSHRKWHPLHDLLPNAHGSEIQQWRDMESPIFAEAEGSVDVPVSAGDLVIGDARILHSAWGNTTNQRRTLILSWLNCFNFPSPPSWWKGGIPLEIATADRKITYKATRVPNIPWKARSPDFDAPWGIAFSQLQQKKKSRKTGTENGKLPLGKLDRKGKDVTISNSFSIQNDSCIKFDPLGLIVDPVLIKPRRSEQKYWQRYQTPEGQSWWWCEIDNDCFFEDEPGPWTQYQDPYSNRLYWWRDDESWFWASS